MGRAQLYDPIVELDSSRITAFEALTTLTAAVESLAFIPLPLRLLVTASPTTLCTGHVLTVLAEVDADRVVVVIPGRDPVDDYDRLGQMTRRLRALGTRLAVDCVGSTIDHMSHVARIGPDIIKLDPSVVVEAAGGGPLAAHARGVVRYADGADIPVIAAGVETVAELEAMRRLGVAYGQGPLLCPPRSLEEWRTRLGLDRSSA